MTTAAFMALGAAAITWLLSLVELAGRWMFAPWAFDVGRQVIAETYRGVDETSPKTIGTTMPTANGVYRWLTQDTLLFRPRVWSAFNTPFPVRGKMTALSGALRVEARVPLSTPAFCVIWLALMLAISVSRMLTGAATSGVAMLVISWSIGAGFLWLSLSFEVRRARRIIAEIRSDLEAST